MEDHPFTKSYHHDGVTVIECLRCGFIHQYPIPSIQDIHSIYSKKFGGVIRKGFRERKKEDVDYWDIVYRRRFLSYTEMFKTSGCSILDIGCGTGAFLNFFKRNGWDVHGIEPSVNFFEDLELASIPFSPKLTDQMIAKDWEELGRFDVVHLSMVLEHIRDPLDLIKTITNYVLKPDAILTIEVPNEFNIFQLAGQKAHNLPAWWIHPLHINYFNFHSLSNLLKKCNLYITLRETQFPMEIFLLFGDNYVGHDDLGRKLHRKRVAFEKNLVNFGAEDLLQEVYRQLANMGIGRDILVHARLGNNERTLL